MSYGKVTYATIPTTGIELRKFWARNCEKLARYLDRLTPEQHQQGMWTNDCGTAGCALGWAALSGKFPGLQYTDRNPFTGVKMIIPVVNGKVKNWSEAGATFFGDVAHICIFNNGHLTRSELQRKLRAEARRLRQ